MATLTNESGDDSVPKDGYKCMTAGSTRRRLLCGAAGLSVGLGGLAGSVSASESCPVSNFTYTIQATTPHKTSVHVIEADQPGPTAVVVGGLHGDEAAGYQTGRDMLEWRLKQGRLVVIPEADVDAIERGTRHGAAGHLNRQFPTGYEPTSGLAQDIWEVIEMHDPAVVIDMHSSRGIWGADTEFDGYGQAIFPTAVSDVPEGAARTVAAMNDRFFEGYPDMYDFTVGEILEGTEPRLIHKVAGDLNRPGYTTEVTEDNTDVSTQITWTKALVSLLLRFHGLETSYASAHF